MILLKSTNNRKIWNSFAKLNNLSFLQSWQWGEIYQQETGQAAYYFKLLDNSRRLGQILFLEKKLSFGKKYLYSPRCRLDSSLLEKIQPEFKKNHSLLFARLEADKESTGINQAVTTVKNLQPQQELVLDLSLDLNQLLAQMKPKTRYNLKLASKKGVKVRELKNQTDFKIFYNLLTAASKRQEFGLHREKHYQIIWQTGQKDQLVRLFIAEHKQKAIACTMISLFGREAYYLHGGSDYHWRALMAPFLLHWEIIKLVKVLGYKYYNFGGIDETRWPGLTRFKRGFGGREINYPQAVDLVINKKWYKIYKYIGQI